MFGDLYDYIGTLGPLWLSVAGSSVPFVVNEALKPSGRYRAWADRFARPEVRRVVLFTLIPLTVFWAGFMAWREEHAARMLAEANSASQTNPYAVSVSGDMSQFVKDDNEQVILSLVLSNSSSSTIKTDLSQAIVSFKGAAYPPRLLNGTLLRPNQPINFRLPLGRFADLPKSGEVIINSNIKYSFMRRSTTRALSVSTAVSYSVTGQVIESQSATRQESEQ